MPAKRELSTPPGTPPATSSAEPSPSKKARNSRSTPKKPWSAKEEARFLAGIDAIVRKSQWIEVRDDVALSKRGGNGIRSHWEALYKKLQK